MNNLDILNKESVELIREAIQNKDSKDIEIYVSENKIAVVSFNQMLYIINNTHEDIESFTEEEAFYLINFLFKNGYFNHHNRDFIIYREKELVKFLGIRSEYSRGKNKEYTSYEIEELEDKIKSELEKYKIKKQIENF
jgi:hypothetical protein